MAKEVPTIEATMRDRLGSRYSKRLRAAGRLPAVLYGHGSEPLAVHVDHKITLHALKKGQHVKRGDVIADGVAFVKVAE